MLAPAHTRPADSSTDAVGRARERLVQLLDATVHEAEADPSHGSITSLKKYTPHSLRTFFKTAHTKNARAYEAYIKRRNAGGPREIFPTREYAMQWLKLAAPVKYVDGSWVSNVLNAGLCAVPAAGTTSTPSQSRDPGAERAAAKMAWQVITEEFGDGDLAKNHVHLYYELIRSLDPSAQPGHIARFDGLAADEGSHRCWTAAVAQQCVGLLASTDDFFPEALGFNMAYETLPYHLLVTSKELRELRINDYYFALHITIDNPDSGHAAMARLAVERFLEGVQAREGESAMQAMWKRVQAGVILADGLPTTPAGPIEFEPVNGAWLPRQTPRPSPPLPTSTEKSMMHLLLHKSAASEKMHCSSRIRIEGATIEDWLNPSSMTKDKALRFLRALGRLRPWVVPGDTAKSRLVRELQWGGRMFGAFSSQETCVVRRWIESLGSTPTVTGAYDRFIGGPVERNIYPQDGRFAHHAANQLLSVADEEIKEIRVRLSGQPTRIPVTDDASLACLWFTHLSVLEHFPLSPTKLASPLGMTCLRVLRALEGFPDLHNSDAVCAGTDHSQDDEEVMGLWEIGRKMFARRGLTISTLADLAHQIPADGDVAMLCADMLALRCRPYAHTPELLGMAQAGLDAFCCNGAVESMMLGTERKVARRIAHDAARAIDECVQQWSEDEDLRHRFEAGRSRLQCEVQ